MGGTQRVRRQDPTSFEDDPMDGHKVPTTTPICIEPDCIPLDYEWEPGHYYIQDTTVVVSIQYDSLVNQTPHNKTYEMWVFKASNQEYDKMIAHLDGVDMFASPLRMVSQGGVTYFINQLCTSLIPE